MPIIAKVLKPDWTVTRVASFMPRVTLVILLGSRGSLMKLRTICTVATIFMAFFTVAVWKAPMREKN
jgi:hypothetical protein